MLAAADEPLSVNTVVSELADRVADPGDHDAVYHCSILLHHVHLPKLEDCGVIEYQDETVTLTADADEVLALLPGDAVT